MSNNKPRTLADIIDDIDKIDCASEQDKISAKLKLFNKFISWTDNDYAEYDQLLDNLKKIKRKRTASTKDIGNALEAVVTFIFNKSFFYKVYPNRSTSTNEIDEFVVLSNNGKQALFEYGFTKELLISSEDYFLCECKNYKDAVGSTWVGKFNTLLDICGNCEVGIIFSCSGLTGDENSWYDAHGLTKVIYRISQENKKRFILDVNIKDLELLRNKERNIFDIIKNKKLALIANVKSKNLHMDIHEGTDKVKAIYDDIIDIKE